MAIDLNGQTILVTGGTGSFGREFIRLLLQRYPRVERLLIYSRDEHKQVELARLCTGSAFRCLEFMLGDVRDLPRLQQACAGVDIVIHAAALKHVPLGESNPMEFVKTNVLGAENVVQAALAAGVKKVIALSSDKAAAPSNLYGSTKLCAEKIFIAANQGKRKSKTTFSVVRYGNVLGSRGSVVPWFVQQRKTGVLPVTHPEMTRFSITPDQEIDLIIYALEYAWGGEIFVPKLPSYRIVDMALAIGPECRQDIVGIRPGEKLHETMVTEADALHTLELHPYYVICPNLPLWNQQAYADHFEGKKVEENFSYHSNENATWLTVDDLREQIATYAQEIWRNAEV